MPYKWGGRTFGQNALDPLTNPLKSDRLTGSFYPERPIDRFQKAPVTRLPGFEATLETMGGPATCPLWALGVAERNKG